VSATAFAAPAGAGVASVPDAAESALQRKFKDLKAKRAAKILQQQQQQKQQHQQSLAENG